MEDYYKLIKSETEILYKLHENIHVTYRNRDKDRRSWSTTCDEFHSYVSKLDPFIERSYEETKYTSEEMLEFVISFLEIDPMFFRSGYIKEEMLRKIKRSLLTENQKNRLRCVLQDAVETRGFREYRSYCRLAAKIANLKLIHALELVAQFDDGVRKSRAKLMLGYIIQQKAHNQKIKATS